MYMCVYTYIYIHLHACIDSTYFILVFVYTICIFGTKYRSNYVSTYVYV